MSGYYGESVLKSNSNKNKDLSTLSPLSVLTQKKRQEIIHELNSNLKKSQDPKITKNCDFLNHIYNNDCRKEVGY